MGRDHAKLSPSSSHRWMVCTASANLEDKIPDVETVYSREGTLARAYPGFEPLPRLREDIALLLDGQPLTNHTPKIVLPEDNTP